MIYTSYFANFRNFPVGSKPISIARFAPKGFTGGQMTVFAPSTKLLLDYKNGKVSNDEYKVQYVEQLNSLEAEGKIKVLENLNGCVLLCYEKTGDFCHRHILAEWLRERGIQVEELKG